MTRRVPWITILLNLSGDVYADVYVRALEWRPGDPGFESRCGNFASGTLAIPFRPYPLSASVFRRRHYVIPTVCTGNV